MKIYWRLIISLQYKFLLMKKKYWFLIILLGLIIFGYIKLFNSTINKKAVPSNADMVSTVDVKKLIRTVLWDVITHPSKWKFSSSGTDTAALIDLKDVFEIPDYVQVFHLTGEQVKNWYCLLQIKKERLFDKALIQRGFTKINSNEYTSATMNMGITKNENNIIVSSYALDSSVNLKNVSNLLFTKKEFLPVEKFSKIASANSHLTLFIAANEFLQNDALLKLNISNSSINIDGELTPQAAYTFVENNFTFNSDALLSLGFTQPSASVYNAICKTDKENISKAIGVNMDTLFIPSNKHYSLSIAGIKPRVDSAITYTYDDDFNKVEKVVVNNVEEPDYSFTIEGDSVQNIYKNWIANKTITTSDAGALFRPMPFVKSFCSVKDSKQLIIAPTNFSSLGNKEQKKAVFYCNILVEKLGEKYLKYFSDDIKNAIIKVGKVNIVCNQNNNKLELKVQINKAEKDGGFLNF